MNRVQGLGSTALSDAGAASPTLYLNYDRASRNPDVAFASTTRLRSIPATWSYSCLDLAMTHRSGRQCKWVKQAMDTLLRSILVITLPTLCWSKSSRVTKDLQKASLQTVRLTITQNLYWAPIVVPSLDTPEDLALRYCWIVYGKLVNWLLMLITWITFLDRHWLGVRRITQSTVSMPGTYTIPQTLSKAQILRESHGYCNVYHRSEAVRSCSDKIPYRYRIRRANQF